MPTTTFDATVPATLLDRAFTGVRDGSFWTEQTPGDRCPTLSADLRVDLAIIGGGYTGLWTALKAKRRDPGARVAVLEARRLGWAASGRNGGFAEASLTHGEENGRTRFPEEYGSLDTLGLANLDAMQAAIAGFERDAAFERNGVFDVATEPHQVPWLAEAADPPRSVLLDQAAMQAQVASPTFRAGLCRPTEGAIVDPAKLVDALVHECRRAGVELFEQTPASALERDGSGMRMSTPGAVVGADRVVLATNAYPPLLKRLRFSTVPVYDYVLMTEPLTADQRASIGWSGRQGIGDAANQFHYYRLSADDRILWGGYDAVYHYGGRVRSRYEDRERSYRRLAAHFFTTFPQLEGVRFSHRWAGAIDTSTRFCAFFGTAAKRRVAYALGYTGLGVSATHFAGDVVLDLLDGLETPATTSRMVRERPLPFPPEPFAWLGVQATRLALDRADHRSGRRGPLLKTLDALGLGFDS